MEVVYLESTKMGVETKKSCWRSLAYIGGPTLCFVIVYFSVSHLFSDINHYIPNAVSSTFGNNEPILKVFVAIASYLILAMLLYLAHECFKWIRKKDTHSERVEEEVGFVTKYLYNGKFGFLLSVDKKKQCNEVDIEKQLHCDDVASTAELLR